MELFSRSWFVRPLTALTFVLLLAALFMSIGLSGFVLPAVILGLGFALAKHEVVPDPWRIGDEELYAWLDSEVQSPGSDRNSH
jgi:hypothetical protein